VNPIKGRRLKLGSGGDRRARRPITPVIARRRGLLSFGAAFVVLFLVVAIAEGIGDPAIPSGDIAIVEDVPGGNGTISEANFEHALDLAATQAGEKSIPKPGDGKYDELKETALNGLFDQAWVEGLGAEMGISVTPKEVAAELTKLKKQNFKDEAAFNKFLKESHYTAEDVNDRVRLQVLSTKIQAQVTEGAPKPDKGEITAYYEEAKATQFTQKASRDVRLIVNKDAKKAEEAKGLLEKDHSAKSWKKVAKKYSEDPLSKESGGLRSGLAEGAIEEPVSAKVFETPENQLEGPLKAPRGYYVFEVENSTPENVQAQKDVESQIESTLTQQAQQESFSAFIANYQSTWRSRTFCASGFTIERCANFKGNGHSTNPPAEPACYEANPKNGLPKTGCPAPIRQLEPALPGSVSVLERRGKPIAQRAQPDRTDEEEEKAEEAPEAPGALPMTP
jgi:parvulin-like peptidyl-prolyl isomerase